MLREMAINFPKGGFAHVLCTPITKFRTDKTEMLEIPGIDPDKVERYGGQFLRLIKTCHEGYEVLMNQLEDRPR